MKFTSLAEVQAHHRERRVNWFGPSEMKFFKTKIHTDLIAGSYFITSEVNPCGEKAYSIRLVEENGDISTVGGFHAYKTLKQAKRALDLLLAELVEQRK